MYTFILSENTNYLLTESEIMPGNIKLRLECIDRAIAIFIITTAIAVVIGC